MSSIIHQTGSVRPLSLQEREQPQLYRELFPYTSICRTTFDEVLLAPRPAEQMRITDTTFRDGQQARPPYTVKQVAKMFDFLHRMGGKTGLITASEFFLYSAKDRKSKADKTKALGVSWTSDKVNEDGTIPDDSAISISGKGVADGKLSIRKGNLAELYVIGTQDATPSDAVWWSDGAAVAVSGTGTVYGVQTGTAKVNVKVRHHHHHRQVNGNRRYP